MRSLRSFLPETEEVAGHVAGQVPAMSTDELVRSLVLWAAELSERIDALPLDQLDKLASTLESHPLLRRMFGG